MFRSSLENGDHLGRRVAQIQRLAAFSQKAFWALLNALFDGLNNFHCELPGSA